MTETPVAIYRFSIYTLMMLKHFKNKVARDIFDGVLSASTRKIPFILHDKIRRLFDQLNAATTIETLRVPPGNRLEKLKGDLKDYWSIRVNKQWRIIFVWKESEAYHVDVIDYH